MTVDARPEELSPREIVALEAALDPWCPAALAGEEYRPELCLPWCRLCADLPIRRKEGSA